MRKRGQRSKENIGDDKKKKKRRKIALILELTIRRDLAITIIMLSGAYVISTI